MEEDNEAEYPVKILIVWSGALVPAYRQFFLELARFMRVRALGPRRWIHGSVSLGHQPSALPTAPAGAGHPDCRILPVVFWPARSARYFVPALPLHLWGFRPRYLYLMEEPDRPAFLWHALLAKLTWPPIRIVCYGLQNIPKPGYRRWHHSLALRLNRLLVHKAVAASREAAEVLAAHGFRCPVATIPLWGSESLFTPGAPDRSAASRESLGIPSDAVVLLFAGSLVEAKGLLLLREVLPRFPRLRLVAAGLGPLESTLRETLGSQWIPMGALQGEELLRFYRLGDYVILPSLTTRDWKEQIGRSLIEGILCGCIALGSDSGHIPELTLVPEATFKQGDAESLAAMLGRLPLANADRVRESQRRNVEERFTAAAVARATYGFLEQVARGAA